MEILKIAGLTSNTSQHSVQNLFIFDQDDYAVALSEDMDFDCIYKIKFLPAVAMSYIPEN